MNYNYIYKKKGYKNGSKCVSGKNSMVLEIMVIWLSFTVTSNG